MLGEREKRAGSDSVHKEWTSGISVIGGSGRGWICQLGGVWCGREDAGWGDWRELVERMVEEEGVDVEGLKMRDAAASRAGGE